ncbi:MAG: hypothetical protein R3F55_16650 [Alphaproteobacteria bacterium]
METGRSATACRRLALAAAILAGGLAVSGEAKALSSGCTTL